MTTDFEGRADQAAAKLKVGMGLPPSQVEVGTDGREIQEPPQGSYAAQELARQQEQVMRDRAAAAEGITAVTPNGEPLPAQQHPTSPVQAEQPNGQGERDQESINARFRELTQRARDAEAAKQEAEQKLQNELAQLRQEREAFERQRQQIQETLAQNLEDLPDEERARILQQAHDRELLEQAKHEMLGIVAPAIDDLRRREQHRELMALADKYPGFDYDVHGQLIQDFTARNPACSAEQAFRAVATIEELGVSPVSRPQVPTAVQPRGTSGTEFIAPAPQRDPQENLREEAQELHRLARSRNPEDQRRHQRLLQQHLGRRLQ